MKKIFLGLILLFPGGMLFSQLAPPTHINSSVVYFVKNSDQGREIRLYDSTSYIGKLDSYTYLRYECSSGRHLFWAQGENNDFVIAELATGQQYIILVLPEKVAESGLVAGLAKPYIDLVPVYPDNQYKIQSALNIIVSQDSEEFTEEEIAEEQKKQKKKIKKHLARYQEDRYRGKLYSRLTRDMYLRYE